MPTDLDWNLFRDFATALLLGALIGLEREKRNARAGTGIAGLRTFVMLSQIGAIGGFLSVRLASPWILAAALAAAATILLGGYVAQARRFPESLGITTELAAIATCLLGALATTGHHELAIGLGVISAALLAYKQPLHALVGRIAGDDVLAVLRLLLATFIVLPLLPDRALDPWGAFNPQKVWLLVLLISALSMVGYVASRWLGPGRGIAVTAATGGLVSSTATTLTFVKQSLEPGASSNQLAGGILLSWTIMFVRVLVAAAVVAPTLALALVLPFGAMVLASGLAAGACMWRRGKGKADAEVASAVPMKNPFSLWAAIKFGVLFAAVQFLLVLGQRYLPAGGVYTIAALAGLTDVDAITLSMAQKAGASPDQVPLAVIAITIAAFTNTATKAAMCVLMGKGLARFVLPGAGAIFVLGAIALAVG